MMPLFPSERPDLWIVSVMGVMAFFPYMLIRNLGLGFLFPDNPLGLVLNSLAWTACMFLIWWGLRKLWRISVERRSGRVSP